MNKFYTLKHSGEGVYKEKGSKFLAFAFPVSNESEFQEKLGLIRKQYHDARHHCYAYIVGLKDQSYRSNDDGEPNHSAGDPILGQIRSFELTNCLVIVVRYFGGTKLGVGGLITAYKTAAAAALKNVPRVILRSRTPFRIEFGYEVTSEVERILDQYDIRYDEKNYTEKVEFLGKVVDESVSEISDQLGMINGVQFQLVEG